MGWRNKDYCRSRSDLKTHRVAEVPLYDMWFVDYSAIGELHGGDTRRYEQRRGLGAARANQVLFIFAERMGKRW